MADAKREVLFQKLGNTWYAFTEIDKEIFYTALPRGVNPHSGQIELYNIIEQESEKVAYCHEKTKAG